MRCADLARVWEFRPRDMYTQGHLQRGLATNGLWYERMRDGTTWDAWKADTGLNKWNPAIDVMERQMAAAPWQELNQA